MEQMKTFQQEFEEACQLVSFYDQDKIVRFIESNDNNREAILDYIDNMLEKSYNYFYSFGEYASYYKAFLGYEEEKNSIVKEIESKKHDMEGLLNFISALIKTGKYDLQEYKEVIRSIIYNYSKGWEVGYCFNNDQLQQIREIADYYKDFEFDSLLFLITAKSEHLQDGLQTASLQELKDLYYWLKDDIDRYSKDWVGYEVERQLSIKENKLALKKCVAELILRAYDRQTLENEFEIDEGDFVDVLMDALKLKVIKNQDQLISYMFAIDYIKPIYTKDGFKSINLDEIANENKINITKKASLFLRGEALARYRSKIYDSVDIDDTETRKALMDSIASQADAVWFEFSKKIISDSELCKLPDAKDKYREIFEILLQRTHLNNFTTKERIKKVLEILPKEWKKEQSVLKAELLKEELEVYEILFSGKQEKLCLKQNGFAHGTVAASNYVYHPNYYKTTYYNVKEAPKYNHRVSKYEVNVSEGGETKKLQCIDMCEDDYFRSRYANEIEICRQYRSKYVGPISELAYNLKKTIAKYSSNYAVDMTEEVEYELNSIFNEFKTTIEKLNQAYKAGERPEKVVSNAEVVVNQ